MLSHPCEDVDDVAASMPLLHIETEVEEVWSDLHEGSLPSANASEPTLMCVMTLDTICPTEPAGIGGASCRRAAERTSSSPLCVTKSSGLTGVSCCSTTRLKRVSPSAASPADVCMHSRFVGRESQACASAMRLAGRVAAVPPPLSLYLNA